MPAAIAVPRSAMPGYKNSDLTEAQTLSRYCLLDAFSFLS